jgi:hypothetical protein
MNTIFFEEQQREEAREINRELHRRRILAGELCGYCNKKPELVDGKVIYGNHTNYGKFWHCSSCDAYVGVHQGTDQPLGRLANKELRSLKKEAHMYFDNLWKVLLHPGVTKNVARSEAYKWLSDKMGTPMAETHIGMFDEDQCRMVIYHSQLKLQSDDDN